MAQAKSGSSEPAAVYRSVDEYVTALGGRKPIQKVLIANNGIAAVKAIRSIRRWAYETFADEKRIQFAVMATPDDLRANAEYIRMADEFIEVPGGTNNNNYANVRLIVETAEHTGADAVWAGWGHASENPVLPDTLRAGGQIAFIGPHGAAMRALGDKIGSTIIAQSAAVPIIPWNGQDLRVNYAETGLPDDLLEAANLRTVEQAVEAAKLVGFPLMVKASEGGGGKGIRRVEEPAALPDAFRQVQAELPGSPVFIMRLAPKARHLEVQLLADEYGNAISLSGRDCSVQRRHQKIVEEGPVLAPPSDVWVEMERAAVRLAREVQYANAGTVEYLYQEATNTFAFLELNPRLQVEHPVTEMITGVNLPACQLQVAMGIPLHRIPDIRRLYGLDPRGDSAIDFETAKQVPPRGHVIAARITAENPALGFRPTSGAVTELNFRSTPDVWGYFSVDSSGRVHEFADSQIGHLFSFGSTRDMARRSMVLALKELSIRGDIHTTIEYLVHMMESDDFKNNHIDTAWLDHRIRNKVAGAKPDALLVAVVGGVVRAHTLLERRATEFVENLERGQQPSVALCGVDVDVELIYDNVKYSFRATRSGVHLYTLACNGSYTQAEVRALSDGGCLVLYCGKSHVVYMHEEVSCLRMIMDSITCEFTDEYDPTQLRASMSGKLARYLVEDGARIAAGTPYVEVEAMKMYMQLLAPEGGVIHLCKPEGSPLEPGALLATVDLDDPSKVNKAETFSGQLPHTAPTSGLLRKPHQQARQAIKVLESVMDGYDIPLDQFEDTLRLLADAYANPSAGLTEFEEALSVTAGRLPFKVKDELQRVLNAHRADLQAAGSESNCFPLLDTNSIAAILDAGFASLPAREQAAYQTNVHPMRVLCQTYAQGSAGAGCLAIAQLLRRYLTVERHFVEQGMEDVVAEARAAYAGKLRNLYDLARAHNQLRQRNHLVLALLRRVARQMKAARSAGLIDLTAPSSRASDDVDGDVDSAPATSFETKSEDDPSPAVYVGILHDLAELRGAACAEVSLEARQLLMVLQQPSATERQKEVQAKLEAAGDAAEYTFRRGFDPHPSLTSLVDSHTIMMDSVMEFFSHANLQLRAAALQVYVRRVYRAYSVRSIRIHPVGVAADAAQQPVMATFLFQDAPERGRSGLLATADSMDNLQLLMSMPMAGRSRSFGSGLSMPTREDGSDATRQGVFGVFADFQHMSDAFEEMLSALQANGSPVRGGGTSAEDPTHVMHICILSSVLDVPDVGADGVPTPSRSGSRARGGSGAAGVLNIGDDRDSGEWEVTIIQRLTNFLQVHRAKLESKFIRRVTFSFPAAHQDEQTAADAARGRGRSGSDVSFSSDTDRRPSSISNSGACLYTFRHSMQFHEDAIVRHIEPPLAGHMELKRLCNFNIRLVPTPNHTVHVYEALPKNAEEVDARKARKRFFVRVLVRQTERLQTTNLYEQYPGPERMFVEALNALNVAMGDALKDTTLPVGNNHIFVNILPSVVVRAELIETVIKKLARRYSSRLRRLRVSQVEFKINAQAEEDAMVVPVRLVASNPTGYVLRVDAYAETVDPMGGQPIFTALNASSPFTYSGGMEHTVGAELHGKPVSTPYAVATPFERRRALAAALSDTVYVYDFLELFQSALEQEWSQYLEQNPSGAARPSRLLSAVELTLVPRSRLHETPLTADTNLPGMDSTTGGDDAFSATPVDEEVLVTTKRAPGKNECGMVAWRMTLCTPECPAGRQLVVIANDITINAGSFGTAEDKLFAKASEFARKNGIPRLYIAANSGARIGLANEVKKLFKAAWTDPADVTKGFKYLYVTKEDHDALAATHSIQAHRVVEEGEERFVIDDIIGKEPDLGVENLRGSGTIAGETSRAYQDTFTLTYVTGRSVGIGAYLVRLGHRTIQKLNNAPIILTGFQALNKLIGTNVYVSNDQLGGPKIMYTNGVSHQVVKHDMEGVAACLRWLSYVPALVNAPLPLREPLGDSVEREIEFVPTKAPYDPRHMMAGHYTTTTPGGAQKWVSGFFDKDSWTECLGGWAKTVIAGRARLGGIPMGVIIPETRTVSTVIPADPAAPQSQETIVQQAGQVWFPDSAYKTAQAIRDFNNEGLPLIIFANWRGFSGGQRDMFDEVLKFGSYIVDALVDYKHPVTVYIPPAGELRGGAWVVVDPTINENVMEMYAAPDSRGGVLEPSGLTAIKFRREDLEAAMERLDPTVRHLRASLASGTLNASEKQLRTRRDTLMGLYMQIANTFADLHDTPGRMQAKGVIRAAVPWRSARTYFYWRLRRRLAEFSLRQQMCAKFPGMSTAEATQHLRRWFLAYSVSEGSRGEALWENDSRVLHWIALSRDSLQTRLQALRRAYIQRQITTLGLDDPSALVSGVMSVLNQLPADNRETLLVALRRSLQA